MAAIGTNFDKMFLHQSVTFSRFSGVTPEGLRFHILPLLCITVVLLGLRSSGIDFLGGFIKSEPSRLITHFVLFVCVLLKSFHVCDKLGQTLLM